MEDVDQVYPKFKCSEEFVVKKTQEWLKKTYKQFKSSKQTHDLTIEKMFEKNAEEEEDNQYLHTEET